MGKQNSRWESRYKAGEHVHDEPLLVVTRFAAALPPGRALDVASGAGRHAIWLAGRGWRVTAVDSSRTAIGILQRRALEGSLEIEAVVADLEGQEFAIEPEAYDLIIVCNYLQRDLFSSIRRGTRIGGVVIAVIALVDDDPAVRPMDPSYLLNPGELRAEFETWEILHAFEGKPAGAPPRRARAELVARKK